MVTMTPDSHCIGLLVAVTLKVKPSVFLFQPSSSTKSPVYSSVVCCRSKLLRDVVVVVGFVLATFASL